MSMSTKMEQPTRSKIPLLLIGGGGHCRSCIDVIEATEEYEIVGIVEADGASSDSFTPYSIVGFDADLPELLQQTPHCVITIGQIKNASVRLKIFTELKAMQAILPTIVAPTAYVSPTAKLGEGTIVMHQALVNGYAQVGDNCIVNSKALIEHDCVVANHCHVSTSAILNGEVILGEGCLIGSGSTLKQSVELVDDVIIGAGSVVLNSINKLGTYCGVVK